MASSKGIIMIAKAILRGWARYFIDESTRNGQVYYLTNRDEIAFINTAYANALEFFENNLVDGRAEKPIPNGLRICNRVLARLAKWAGYEPGSERFKALEEALACHHPEDLTLVWSTAKVAYDKSASTTPYNRVVDGFRFYGHSCLSGESRAGEAYDCAGAYKGSLGSPDFSGRINIWKLPEGGLGAEVGYGFPENRIGSITRFLRNEGIIPLDEYFNEGGEAFSAEMDIPPDGCGVGYCDYLGARHGNAAKVWPYRHSHAFTDTTEGRILYPDGVDTLDDEDEEPTCAICGAAYDLVYADFNDTWVCRNDESCLSYIPAAVCENCGEVFPRADCYLEVSTSEDRTVTLCESCYSELNGWSCVYCGTDYTGAVKPHMVEDEPVCSHCVESRTWTCPDCEKTFRETTESYGSPTVCLDCYRERLRNERETLPES